MLMAVYVPAFLVFIVVSYVHVSRTLRDAGVDSPGRDSG